jgi:putative spermidine/putrescine transport system permease protein
MLTLAPVLVGVVYAVGAAIGVLGAGADGISLHRVVNVLSSRGTWSSVAWTVMVSAIATGAAFWAAVISVERLWSTPVMRRIAFVPLAVPHIAGALGVLLLIGQSGLLSRIAFALGLITQPADFPALVYDPFGIGLILSFFWKEFPFLALTAFAARSQIPPSLFEAAHSLGATTHDVNRLVVRPIVAAGILPATISVFAFLVGHYEMASVLGPSAPPALSVLTYERVTDPDVLRRGEAYVLAVLALGLAAVMAWGYARLRRWPQLT